VGSYYGEAAVAWAGPNAAGRRRGAGAATSKHQTPAITLNNRTAIFSDCRQGPAYSLQSLAEHFRVHSHADTEVIGQTEKMSGHG
jgi:hypothetical protein